MRIKILPVITLLFVAIIMVISGCTKEYKEATTVTDVDGNVYDIVKIGNQEWLGSNLNVRHYRNGEALPNGLVAANTRKAGAWTYYGNSEDLGLIYGKLYNSYAVHDPRGLAPEGWHVATLDDWLELIEFCGGADVAGGMLKGTGTDLWVSPNTGATDMYGFNALPGSYGAYSFYYLGEYASFWTSSLEPGASRGTYNFWLYHNKNKIEQDWDFGGSGYSVRCVRDKE